MKTDTRVQIAAPMNIRLLGFMSRFKWCQYFTCIAFEIFIDVTLIKVIEDLSAMSDMRRKDKEIKERVVLEEILLENDVGRLGTAVNGVPYVVPMNYAYRDGRIYLHTHRDGKKVRDIQVNPVVCFEVDSGEMIEGEDPCNFSWRYRSVIATGEARILGDDEEKLKVLKMISDKYSFGKGQLLDLEKVSPLKHLVVIEVQIESMTGKKSPA